MLTLGIDPGLSGAVGALVDGVPFGFVDCPTVVTKVGKNTKRVSDATGMRQALIGFYLKHGQSQVHAQVFIEKVGAMPGQGVTSMFSFGVNYGMWQGVVTALKFPLTFVTPQAWKKVMLAGTSKDKGASLLRARQLWPDQAEWFSRKKDEGRAEALLIAEYGRRLGAQ